MEATGVSSSGSVIAELEKGHAEGLEQQKAITEFSDKMKGENALVTAERTTNDLKWSNINSAIQSIGR